MSKNSPNPSERVNDEVPVDSGYSLDLPNDLPPVEPPSAGMIIQLFLVPAVIVAVIVGVYTAFGTLASQELEWRQLVVDVKSENPHVRWRGALGLAQMLDADAQRGERSQNLADNSEIASALIEVYAELIAQPNPTEEEEKQVEFLSKALGRMRVQTLILPVFRDGIQSDREEGIRKHSLTGLAMLTGSVNTAGHSVSDPDLVAEVIEISRETNRLMRHQSTYILGLVDSPEAASRLEVLLLDSDQMTQVNAAIGLARSGSTAGYEVFQKLVQDGASWKLDPSGVSTQEQESEYFERMLMLKNALQAIQELSGRFDKSQNSQLSSDLEILLKSSRDLVLNAQIREVSAALSPVVR